MAQRVAQSTRSNIAGGGRATRQRRRGSGEAEKWSSNEADGGKSGMAGSKSSKPSMNHIPSPCAARVDLKRSAYARSPDRLKQLRRFDITHNA